MADPEEAVLQVAVPAGDGDPEAVAEGEPELLRVDALGREDPGDDGRAVLVGREELEAHRLRALAAGAAEADVPVEGRLQALLEEEAERDVQRLDERDGGRERALELRLAGARALPVVVEARARAERLPGGRRDGGDAEPGRGHQRLLRAGGDDVDPPLVGLERDGAEARDRVDDDERAGRPRGGGERLEVGDDAGGGLGVRQEDGLRAAELLEAGGEVVRARRLAPLVLDGLDVGAVGGGELLPALAERAGGDDDHAVAGRAEVRDGGLHRAGAGAGEEQDVVRGAAHLREPLEASRGRAPCSRARGGGAPARRARPAPPEAPASAPG